MAVPFQYCAPLSKDSSQVSCCHNRKMGHSHSSAGSNDSNGLLADGLFTGAYKLPYLFYRFLYKEFTLSQGYGLCLESSGKSTP